MVIRCRWVTGLRADSLCTKHRNRNSAGGSGKGLMPTFVS
jgi:hypothetical protein